MHKRSKRWYNRSQRRKVHTALKLGADPEEVQIGKRYFVEQHPDGENQTAQQAQEVQDGV